MIQRFNHGLVIGKFYPPHAGHQYLIDTAAQWSVQVTVVVMAADVESIPLEQRVTWLRTIYRKATHVSIVGVIDNDSIDLHSDEIWRRHVDHMRRGVVAADRLRGALPRPVDAVFTSENYGEELARRFAAAAVCVDPARQLYPVSGTAVRSNPAAHWQLLSPAVRQTLCQRIVIVGAESTGKTTLALELTAALRSRGGHWSATGWVAEYGREYTINKLAVEQARARLHDASPPTMESLRWETSEFEHIASVQQQHEDLAAAQAGPVVICDTDAFATEIWHERYLRHRTGALQLLAAQVPPRLGYLLTEWHDVPFEQDGIRDGEHLREWMHQAFIERLQAAAAPYRIVSGSPQERIAQAITWIDRQLAAAWQFADPLM